MRSSQLKMNIQNIPHPIYKNCTFPKSQPATMMDSDLVSSLNLQKLLYFDYYFYFVFNYLVIAIFMWKVYTLSVEFSIDNFVRFAILIVNLILEGFKLSNGYYGNLKESFPELITFIVICFVNVIFLFVLSQYRNQLPLEVALIIFAVIINVAQLILGIVVAKNFSDYQSIQFYLKSSSSQYNFKREQENKRKQQYQQLQNELTE